MMALNEEPFPAPGPNVPRYRSIENIIPEENEPLLPRIGAVDPFAEGYPEPVGNAPSPTPAATPAFNPTATPIFTPTPTATFTPTPTATFTPGPTPTAAPVNVSPNMITTPVPGFYNPPPNQTMAPAYVDQYLYPEYFNPPPGETIAPAPVDQYFYPQTAAPYNPPPNESMYPDYVTAPDWMNPAPNEEMTATPVDQYIPYDLANPAPNEEMVATPVDQYLLPEETEEGEIAVPRAEPVPPEPAGIYDLVPPPTIEDIDSMGLTPFLRSRYNPFYGFLSTSPTINFGGGRAGVAGGGSAFGAGGSTGYWDAQGNFWSGMTPVPGSTAGEQMSKGSEGGYMGRPGGGIYGILAGLGEPGGVGGGPHLNAKQV